MTDGAGADVCSAVRREAAMILRRGGDQVEDALTRWRDAGLISAQTDEQVRGFERERRAAGAPPGATGRVADAAACVGVALVAAAALLLAFSQFEGDFGPQLAVLSVVGAVALGASTAARRLRLAAAADLLAGAAVALWSVAIAVALDELGGGDDAELGWAVICAAVALIGIAVWRATRSISAGTLAVTAWIALPLALIVNNDFEQLFDSETSTAAAAGALILMTLAAALALLGARLAQRRGWVDFTTVWCAAFVATTALGVGVGLVAIARDEAGFDFAFPAGAAAATAIAVQRRESVWLPSASCLFYCASVAALIDIEDVPRTALALLLLALSFFPFAPLARRLPEHWLVRVWELVVWAGGLTAAIGFAAADGGWPAAGGVWAAAMILSAALQRRWLAMAGGVIGLYVVFLMIVIETFNASAGAGFGTLVFGLLVLAAVLAWRRRGALG